MVAKMWFGNVSHAQWVPVPATGMQKVREGRSEEMLFYNGGLWVENSAGAHIVYDMQFPVTDSSEYEGIEAFGRFASGEYGDDYVRFCDPMQYDQNLLSEVWAAPGLSEPGQKWIYDTEPSFSDTSANSYQKPLRKATYSITTASGAVPEGQNSVFTLLIPPTHTLHFGASGSVTGSGVYRIQPINLDGTLATVTDVTLSSDASSPAFSATFSGATYRAIRIYLTRTSSAASTVTVTAAWAQLALTGITPTITRHIPGKGHSGLRVRGSGRAEEYVMADRHLTGAAIRLAEVEPWS